MKTLIIDGRRCKTRELTFAYLGKKLAFPPYFGNNLDALHDVLSSCREPIHFQMRYLSSFESNLGVWGINLLRVFQHAADENRNLTIEII
ncbi:MAG TPA: barstar family protein [Oscillospiraceae bacterium]|nr:barstar family protein [Oscillospiraceae bacterium]HPS34094.1 barstar family protein [Oscillospiraceae bacterium]